MPGTHRFTVLTSKLAALGAVGKAGLGALLTAAGVLGAGVAGALPAPVDQAVRGAVEAVSPVDFDEPGPEVGDGAGDGENDGFGARVAADATGGSDGEKGVDGPSIAASNPGARHRADRASGDGPGRSGETGLRRADETPAAGHVPDVPPGTIPARADAPEAGLGRPDPAGPGAVVPSTAPPRGGRADGPEAAG